MYPAMSLIKHPYRLLVIGQSQSGKTTFAVQVIEYLIPQVDEVYIASPTYEFQPTFNPIRKKVTIAHESPEDLFKALYKSIANAWGDEEDHKAGTKVPVKRLLIIDDCSYMKVLNEGNKGTLNGFAYNAVWWNLSILCIVHKAANIGAGMKENCDGLAIFNVIHKEMKPLFDTFGITKNYKQFVAMMHKFIKEKIERDEDQYPFLFYVLKSSKLYFKLQEQLILE